MSLYFLLNFAMSLKLLKKIKICFSKWAQTTQVSGLAKQANASGNSLQAASWSAAVRAWCCYGLSPSCARTLQGELGAAVLTLRARRPSLQTKAMLLAPCSQPHDNLPAVTATVVRTAAIAVPGTVLAICTHYLT